MKSSSIMNLIVLFVSINLFINNVLSDQIFSPYTGSAFGRSSHEPKYKIEFHSQKTPFQPDNDQESMVMSNKDGQKYLCFFPKEEKTKPRKLITQQNATKLVLETEMTQDKLKTPDELLEVLKGNCLYRQEGWWSYELCYKKALRQLHVEEDKIIQEFVLGVYDEEATLAFNQNLTDVSILKDPRSKDASQRYHAHQYTNGTKCDLTNEPRETEVRFVCSESRAVISSVTELSTCKYALTLYSPMLCKHPMFQEQRPVWHTINCNEIPKEGRAEKVEEVSLKGKQISMVTDGKVPTTYDSEQHAT
ncbi:Protein OS-9 [Ranunculus cassubicifolius]